MGKIVSEAEVWTVLGEGGELSEWEKAVCDMAIRKAEGVVIQYLGYDPVWGESTEFLPRVVGGNRRDFLGLSKLPVREWEGMTVWVDREKTFGAGTEFDGWQVVWDGVDGDGKFLSKSGFLRKKAGSWSVEVGVVKVLYIGGFKASELRGEGGGGYNGVPIWQAVLNESVRAAKKFLSLAKRQGALHLAGVPTSERLGDYSYSLGSLGESWLMGKGTLSEESLVLLDDFVNYQVLLGG